MDRALTYEASMSWCPDFPRKSTHGDGPKQRTVQTRPSLIDNLSKSSQSDSPGFVSVYSFPHGHSQEGEIPKIDTLSLTSTFRQEKESMTLNLEARPNTGDATYPSCSFAHA